MGEIFPHEREAESVATAQPEVSRRDALKGIAAGFGAATTFLMQGEHAKGTTLNDVQKHRSAVEAMPTQGRRLTLEYNPEQLGEGMLAPGMVQPKSMVLQPMRLSKTLSGSRGVRTGIYLPTPQNTAYQRHVLEDTYVVADGRLLSPDEYETEHVFSEPVRESPHRWAMTKFDIDVSRAKQVTVVSDTWVLLPEYDCVAKLKQEMDKQARVLAQQHRVPLQTALAHVQKLVQGKMLEFGISDSTDYAYAAPILQELSQGNNLATRNKVLAGLRGASALQYQDSIKDMNPAYVQRATAGDCGVKAKRAQLGAGGALETVIGIRRDPTDAYGGLHATNYGLAGGKSFCADAQSSGNVLLYPTSSKLIVTQVGSVTNFPRGVRFPESLNGKHQGTNNGAYNSGTYKTSRVTASTLQGGPAQRQLQVLARKGVDDKAMAYADFHRNQMRANIA